MKEVDILKLEEAAEVYKKEPTVENLKEVVISYGYELGEYYGENLHSDESYYNAYKNYLETHHPEICSSIDWDWAGYLGGLSEAVDDYFNYDYDYRNEIDIFVRAIFEANLQDKFFNKLIG